MNTTSTIVKGNGNIALADKLLRVVIGTVAIVTFLHFSIADDANLSYEILVSLIVVLSGIIGWDPIYKFARRLKARKSEEKLRTYPV